jgi:hypothetical protein
MLIIDEDRLTQDDINSATLLKELQNGPCVNLVIFGNQFWVIDVKEFNKKQKQTREIEFLLKKWHQKLDGKSNETRHHNSVFPDLDDKNNIISDNDYLVIQVDNNGVRAWDNTVQFKSIVDVDLFLHDVIEALKLKK